MKNTTKDKFRRYKVSDAELAALVIYNADCQRQRLQLNTSPCCRNRVMAAALVHMPNRFQLCHATRRVTRVIHDGISDRMATTINRALEYVANHERAAA